MDKGGDRWLWIPYPKRVEDRLASPRKKAFDEGGVGRPFGLSYLPCVAVETVDRWKNSLINAVQTSSGTVRSLRPVGILAVEIVHHPALHSDVERNDHVVVGLY